jgi:hypothetical protein
MENSPNITDSPGAKAIKTGIWIYFFLVIFEGALRKWVLPGLASPLLIIRDPIALWLLIAAWRKGLLVFNPYMKLMVGIGIIGIFTTLLFGHGNVWVALYGARGLLVHFPFIFLVGQVFNRDDVIKVAKATVWLAIPMTLLIAFQFYSPQSAFVNQGVGGTDSAGFTGALNFFRPPATFSFTNGTTLFYSFLAPFVLYFWLFKGFNRIVLLAATACLFASIPLSISRGLLFQVCLSVIFMLIGVLRRPEYAGKLLIAVMGLIIVLIPASQSTYFQTATEVFSERFTTANKAEGGMNGVLVDRYLGGMAFALGNAPNAPVTGYGLGMGTNVGSMLLSGHIDFLIAEEEWGRTIGELGPFMGLAIILTRLLMAFYLLLACFKKLGENDFLPWLLLSFGLIQVAQGGWAQPTSLGFCVMIGGLTIASLNTAAHNGQQVIDTRSNTSNT